MPKGQTGFDFSRHVRTMKCDCGAFMTREGQTSHMMGEFDRYVCRQCHTTRMVLVRMMPQVLYMQPGITIEQARRNAGVDKESVDRLKCGVTLEELDGVA